jgi:3-carboxy-cis,cis-muconate cycloisomerase
LAQAKYMLCGLVAHPEQKMKNLQPTDGLVNTEAVMMALGPRMGRGKAHDKISEICIAVSQGRAWLIDLLAEEPEISKVFNRQALERMLDPTNYVGNCGAMVDRALNGRKGRSS